MSNLNLLEMINDVQKFIENFEHKYGLSVDIKIGSTKSQFCYHKKSLKFIESIVIAKMHMDEPTLFHITSFKNRLRTTKFTRYSQTFQHIAHKSGFTKVSIANYIKRNHASTIHAIKQAENYLFCNNLKFTDIYFWSILNILISKKNHYVGTISDDAEKQDNTKSMSTAIWD